MVSEPVQLGYPDSFVGHLPVAGCEPKSNDATCAGTDNEIEETLYAYQVAQLLFELSEDFELHNAAHAAAIKVLV